MEHSQVENLSASLVREYLARKKLVRTLKLLDEEQPEHAACLRSRLKLLKALHIGRIIKRNKAIGYQLDSMVEVIVHFLLGHARSSRNVAGDLGEKKEKDDHKLLPDGDKCKVLESGHMSKNGQDTEVTFKKSDVDVIGTPVRGEFILNDPVANNNNNNSNNNSNNNDRQIAFDIQNKSTNYENLGWEEALTITVPRTVQGSDVLRDTNNSEVEVTIDQRDSTSSSCYSSDSESSSSGSYSDSESVTSVNSIIDLTQENGAQNKIAAAEPLHFKMPTVGNVVASRGEAEDYEDDDDLEVIDVGGLEAQVSASAHEEVVSGKPTRLGVDPASRPGTQESANNHAISPRHLFLYKNGDSHENGGGTGGVGGGDDGGRGGVFSPPVMKINTQVPNFSGRRTFDTKLDTFRPHVNGNEMKNGLHTPLKAHTNGHIPNGLSANLMNGHMHKNGTIQNGSVPHGLHGRGGKSVFDTDADVDIASMAAQRDQLRGTRSVRGMMAPVMSKEQEDANTRRASSRMNLSKQRSESILGNHEIPESHEESIFMSHDPPEGDDDILGNMARRRRSILDLKNQAGGVLSGLHGVNLRPPMDYLTDAGRQGDIMAQSMRRQSLRGSKQSLTEGGYSNIESATSSRMSMGNGSPDEFTNFKGEGDDVNGDKVRIPPKFIPNSHEDIQILNLQGFMDANSFMGDGGSTSRRKHKKKKGKRLNEAGLIEKARDHYKLGSKPRRKRSQRLSNKSHFSDDDGEVVLKDIDDLDDKVAGLVLGPKNTSMENSGRPISLEEASDLKILLMGSPAQTMPNEWMIQNFKQNSNPNLSYGLIQKKGGPCGILACVQAYMMKSLIFGSVVAPNMSPISPLRPSSREWSWALSAAITEILWKAGHEQKAILALPGSFAHFNEHGVGRYTRDGLTETLTLHEYVEQHQLHDAVSSHLSAFTNESSAGCIVLLYSALLCRGIENVKTDMDAGGGHLINAHGYSSQEIVNLLITGTAASNTFNGEQTLGTDPEQSVVLKGIQHKSEIGFLSLFEHYDCYKVGSHLKSPHYPVWVVCCESHFSVIFSRNTLVTSDSPSVAKYDIYYYDGLAQQDDEIRLTIDLDGEEPDVPVVPPLEHCIRTKWHSAAVDWNGIDPIL